MNKDRKATKRAKREQRREERLEATKQLITMGFQIACL